MENIVYTHEMWFGTIKQMPLPYKPEFASIHVLDHICKKNLTKTKYCMNYEGVSSYSH
jgi:hypothetical protein